MIRDVEKLLERYWAWLRDETIVRALDEWVEISTPYLDRRNDCLQIYAKRTGDGVLLTDDGYVLDDLELSGCRTDREPFASIITTTLNGLGIRRNGQNLEVDALPHTFATGKHNLLQAMLAIGDVSYLAKPSRGEHAAFPDAVGAWFEGEHVRCTPNVNLAGRSGYNHRFEFVIPKSQKRPERVIRTFSRPNRTSVQTMAFSWIDTKAARSPDSSAYAILNDDEREVADEVLAAMRSYDVVPITWSRRDAALEEFAG